MDNRSKAQAHIERAQMYLGIGETEFGQADFGGVFDFFKKERTDEELLERAATPAEDLMPRNTLTQAVKYVEKKTQDLKEKVGEKSKKIVDRKLKKRARELKDGLSNASNNLARILVIEMENRFQAERFALKTQRNDVCGHKVEQYTDGFEYTENEKSSVGQRARDMCEQYYPQAQPEYIPIILNVLESTKQSSEYKDWRKLELGYIRLLREQSKAEITENDSAYKNLQSSVSDITNGLLYSQDPLKRELVKLLADILRNTPS